MVVCASGIIIGHFDDLPLGVFVYVIRPAPTILHDIKECLGSLPGTLTYLGSMMPERGTDHRLRDEAARPEGWSPVSRLPAT